MGVKIGNYSTLCQLLYHYHIFIICIMFIWMLKTSLNKIEKGEEEIVNNEYKEKVNILYNKL